MRVPAPKIPTIAPTGPGNDYQTDRAPAAAFGAENAQALRQGGADLERGAAAISQAVNMIQAQKNETAVNDAYSTDFGPKFRDLYQQYYSLQGKDAVDQMPAFQAKMQDLRQAARGKLTNPQQQLMFDQVSRRRVEMELDAMGRYRDQQDKIYQAQTSDATLKNSLDDAADKWNDESAFGSALGNGYAEIDRYATRTGQSAEVARARASEFTSKAMVGRIQSAMVHDPEYAQGLYELDKKNITAAERPVLEQQLKTRVMPVQAKRDAMGIISADAPKDGAPMTATQIRAHIGSWMSQAEEVANKKYPDDPIYRDLVVSQLSTYANRIATAEEALQRNARNSLLATALTPDANGERPSDINKLLATPAAQDAWNRMEPGEQLGLLNVLEHNGKGVDPPETLEALNKYHELRGLAVNDPAAFQKEMSENFTAIGKQLPRSLFLQLIQQDTAIDKGAAKDASTTMNAQRIHTVTDGLLQQAGFKLPKGKDEKRQDVMDAYQNWTGRMLEAVQQFTDEHKKRPSDIELRQIGQRLLIQGYETGTGHTWFGYTWGRKPVKAFEAGDQFAVPAPPAEAAKIKAAYNKTFGRDPTPEEIDKWYAARLQQGKP